MLDRAFLFLLLPLRISEDEVNYAKKKKILRELYAKCGIFSYFRMTLTVSQNIRQIV